MNSRGLIRSHFSPRTALIRAKKARDMEPMKPMKPMAPMAPMKMATEAWWPAALGAPSSAGSSNDVHYAYFAGKHRLAVRQHDHVRLFDTDGKHLSGFKSDGTGELVFDTDDGAIDLHSFKEVTSS